MQNYFENEVKNVERELLWLKTSGQKSASAIDTASEKISLNVNLEYQEISYLTGSARASKWYRVRTDDDAIIVPTLSWYYGDISQAANPEFTTREIQMSTGIMNGVFVIGLYFIGTEKGDNSDAARVKRGETVTVSVDLNIVCTSEFTVEEFTP